MAAFDSTDTVKFTAQSDWRNWHQTVDQAITGIYDIYNPPGSAVTLAAMKTSAADVQWAIGRAKAAGKHVRALGSGWSLSRAPTTDGVMLNLGNLNRVLKVNANSLHPARNGQGAEGIFVIQAGMNVSEVNKYVEANGRSLRTSGAANGQTFAGAMSTATHGSALDFGGIQDHVHGIHLLTGNRSWWLERATDPLLADSFAAAIGATLKRDDDLFNAALVSMGSMGVIHALAIETAPLFLLETENRIFDPIPAALRTVMGTLDFAGNPALFPKGKPYFCQIVINPHEKQPQAYVTTMYQKPCPADYKPHYAIEGGIKPGYDVISVLGGILDTVPALTPAIAGLAAKQLMTAGSKVGTWGEIFTYKSPQAKVNSGSICVPLERGNEALDLLLALMKKEGPVPLVFAVRFVRRTPALLGFQRWPVSFVINMDGVFNKSSTAFLAKAASAVEAAGIPFTQHWGKMHAYTPARLHAAYQGDLDKWKAARATLMPDPADRAAFDSAWMHEVGLA